MKKEPICPAKLLGKTLLYFIFIGGIGGMGWPLYAKGAMSLPTQFFWVGTIVICVWGVSKFNHGRDGSTEKVEEVVVPTARLARKGKRHVR